MRRPPPLPGGSPGRAAAAATACLLVATTAAGCLNFVEPEPGPGSLSAGLAIEDAGSPRAQLSGAFRLAADGDGDLRAPTDSTLRIGGRTLEPSDPSTPLLLRYRATWAPGPAALDSARIELVGPRAGGRQRRGRVALPNIWRAGPDTVQVTAGEPTPLPLQGVPETSAGDLLEIRWQLTVHGESRSYSEEGSGAPPDTLRVPAGAVPAEEGPPFEARLVVNVDARGPASAPYVINVQLGTRLEWHLLRP